MSLCHLGEKSWLEFWAPGLTAVQPWLLGAFGKYISGWSSLPAFQIKCKYIFKSILKIELFTEKSDREGEAEIF